MLLLAMMPVSIRKHHTQAALLPERVPEDAYSIWACLYTVRTVYWSCHDGWLSILHRIMDGQKFVRSRLEPHMKKAAVVHITMSMHNMSKHNIISI